MKKKTKNKCSKCALISRREALKISGLAAGALAGGGLAALGGTSQYGWGNPNRPAPPPPRRPGRAGRHGRGNSDAPVGGCYPTDEPTEQYDYINQLEPIIPWGWDFQGNVTGTKLEANEMRITFMGSVVPMVRRAQMEMSIFVEVGWNDAANKPEDQFVLDLGCGVTTNYQACGVGFGRMDKIFLTHLHADHMNDLIQVYGFGNSSDRKSPLFVWGHGKSGVPNPGMTPAINSTAGPLQEIVDSAGVVTGITSALPPANNYSSEPTSYDDGVKAFCTYLREACRWHTESQAFLGTAYQSCRTLAQFAADWGLPSYVLPLAPAGVYPDPSNDAYALIPIQLDWTKKGLDSVLRPTGDNIAYNNAATRATVMHYPVIHCRKGSMGYKIQWLPPGAAKPLTMIFSGDTRPEWNSINQAINRDARGNPQGVDVFIHEMAVAPEIWAMKNQGLTQPGSGPQWDATVNAMIAVQNSSHTAQGAFGYMLSQINPRPRLAVATHFPTADDTVACALRSVQAHCPEIRRDGDKLVWSFDLMVLRVFPDRIEQRKAVVNNFSFDPPIPQFDTHSDMYAPKYHDENGASNPIEQLDNDGTTAVAIPPGDDTYREDGY